MHVEIIDDFKMIIYLNNMQINSVDFNKKEDLQEYFKKLFRNLKNFYNMNINGFYNINVYKDEYYGIILEIEKEDIDYIEYFDGQVDMNITVESDNIFLYEIDDYFNIDEKIINKIKVYQYKNKLYIKIISNISNVDFGEMLEFSKIIYANESEQIIKYGKEINIDKFLTIKR